MKEAASKDVKAAKKQYVKPEAQKYAPASQVSGSGGGGGGGTYYYYYYVYYY